MNAANTDLADLGPQLERLALAVMIGDRAAVEIELRELLEVRWDSQLATMRRLATRLCDALAIFSAGSGGRGLGPGAQNARQRLLATLEAIEQAAVRTERLIESSPALVDILVGKPGFQTPEAHDAGAQLRRQLADVLMIHERHELNMQVLHGVVALVAEIEAAVAELGGLAASARPLRIVASNR